MARSGWERFQWRGLANKAANVVERNEARSSSPEQLFPTTYGFGDNKTKEGTNHTCYGEPTCPYLCRLTQLEVRAELLRNASGDSCDMFRCVW